MTRNGRLVVVSNRLPITVEAAGNSPQLKASDGGLVSAVAPILRKCGGCWVGWTGTDYDERLDHSLQEWSSLEKYSIGPVFLSAEEADSFYRGYSNEIIWPLFHGVPSRCNFSPSYWTGHRAATEKFADAVEKVSSGDDFVWVHDYHLMMLAPALRRRGLQRLAYFHHIPFPSPDVFGALPWRTEILRGLIRFDVLGFQTARDRSNFAACLSQYLTDVGILQHDGKMIVRSGTNHTTVGTYPVSIDFGQFAEESDTPEVIAAAQGIRECASGAQIVLGVDRLDYTKGIPQRLAAFETLLERHPSLTRRVVMLQSIVPSREEIPEYDRLKVTIETMVGRINGKFALPGWVPIHYFYRGISRRELLAFYRAADIALVTPLKDGMNLVAKEYCAAKTDGRGVLVLSEFAGAAEELKSGALIVNPHDLEGMVSALFRALRMGVDEQRLRMENMRAHLRRHDVFHWYRSIALKFLTSSAASPAARLPWTREATPATG